MLSNTTTPLQTQLLVLDTRQIHYYKINALINVVNLAKLISQLKNSIDVINKVKTMLKLVLLLGVSLEVFFYLYSLYVVYVWELVLHCVVDCVAVVVRSVNVSGHFVPVLEVLWHMSSAVVVLDLQ